jgi:hypothetical protein
MHVNRRSGHPGVDPVRRFESSPAVSSLLRVISHRIPIPGWKSSWLSALAGVARGEDAGCS